MIPTSSQALLGEYDPETFFDEWFSGPGEVREGLRTMGEMMSSMSAGELRRRQESAERALMRMGITFQVYGEEAKKEQVFPFDVLPRVITGEEWDGVERGLRQRITALNAFVADVYGQKHILRDGVVPEQVVYSSSGYMQPCEGMKPPLGVWCHVSGSDLVRDEKGDFFVLEDNLRCPSGVSYVLANRLVMKRTFPEMFSRMKVRAVSDFPDMLLQTLCDVCPAGSGVPTMVVLTPGIFNSAYFEHAFLAQQIGAELVEGRDLVVSEGFVCMKTTRGLKRVDVIYRRINEEYLDPAMFRPDSLLGVKGLMDVFEAGRVSIANMPGPGVADDKGVYPYVPEMIRYYLKEEPLLRNVPTWLCSREDECAHVLANLEDLVVKEAHGAGGYGMLIGPKSTREERRRFKEKIRANPRGYIAQPTLSLSRAPVLLEGEERMEGRHLDLRPFVLYGKTIKVLPGGLTRVALKKGSLVVNSSQGGGSKDTWVLKSDGGGA